MSILTVLSVLLAIGFIVVGFVGFLGWRERMAPAVISPRRDQNRHSRTQ